MSGYDYGGRPFVPHQVSNESLHHPGLDSRISSISDLSEAARSPPPLYDPQYTSNRDSIVSAMSVEDLPHGDDVDISHVRLTSPTSREPSRFGVGIPAVPQALRAGPPPSPSSNFNRSSWGAVGGSTYEPISAGGLTRQQSGGISGRFKSLRSIAGGRSSRHPSIAEEGDEMEIGLVGNAYKFGITDTSYSNIDGINEEEGEDGFGVDLSSFTGPMNERTVQLEREGTLTGGLGAGAVPDVRMSEHALLTSPTSPTAPTRGFSMLMRNRTRLSRGSTIKAIAQAEANRRGQVIEVVVEEGSETPPEPSGHRRAISDEAGNGAGAGIDLSSFGGFSQDPTDGEDIIPGAQSRNSTYKLNKAVPLKKTEVFYPEANWKPHSMRWPYLTVLVLVSAGLAVVQEYVFQLSNSKRALNPPEGLFTFSRLEDLSTWDYFTFKYLPTIIAVTYGILWQLTDFEVKRLEAYYQLSKPEGALAAESINVDYITIFSFWRPIQAIRFRHWAVAISSVSTLLAVSAVPVLQAATIVLDKGAPPAGDTSPVDKLIVISGVWSRFLSAVLALIAVLGLILLFILQRRKSGLMNDVKGIAGIAAMATKSHILMDFKDLDTVPPQDIHNKLKRHRYTLRNSSLAPSGERLSEADKNKYDRHHLSPNPHPLMLRLAAGGPFIGGMIAFSAFLPLVLFIPGANIVTDKASWFLTACAVVIKIAYQTLEQDLRMMEPFYRLSCRHASPKVLTLDYTGMAFGYMPLNALLNGDTLVAFVGLGSVFAEILTVCVTSFAGVTGADFLPIGSNFNGDANVNEGEETMLSFWVSFSISMATLIYLILTALLTYHLRRHPFLPRQPSTIASVLGYIHQSKMLYDFVDEDANSSASGIMGSAVGIPQVVKRRTGRQDIDNDEMVRRLIVARKRYGLGWFTGRDGQTHCGVDVEELQRGYRHGVGEDLRLARAGVGWDTEL